LQEDVALLARHDDRRRDTVAAEVGTQLAAGQHLAAGRRGLAVDFQFIGIAGVGNTNDLSKQRLDRYFVQDGDQWRIKDEIRAMVTFKKMNLMKPFSGLGKFDMILCRNVAIYFTAQDRRSLFEKIADVLDPNGVLIIGSTESLTNEITFFQPQRYLNSTFYIHKSNS
jgi:chemotaxis methyl-accepting protein methylase